MKHLIFKYAGLICIGLLLLSKNTNAQTTYHRLIDSAMQAYQNKAYAQAGAYFAQAAQLNGGLALQQNRYNAACSWALAKQKDKAFAELNRILSGKGILKGWDDPAEFHEMLIKDTDFDGLKKDKRWAKLVEVSNQRKKSFEAQLDKNLVAELAKIKKDDQDLRLQLNTIRKDKGLNSAEEKELWKQINSNDSVNVVKISNLIDQKGWLSPAQVGFLGNQTLFLVIQHASLTVQQKYLPMMRLAVQKGNALAKDLALLEDRVAMRVGKSQIYGSQVGIDKDSKSYYLFPVVDPDHLDDRRAKVGLEPISNYLKGFNLNWDLATYKKELPALEAKVKKK